MRNHRLAVNILFFIAGFLYNNWISRLPELQGIYDLDYGLVGTILLYIAVGALVAMPLTAYFIIKYGSRKVTIISAILSCMFVPLIPILPSLWFLGVVFFLYGFLTGMMDVAMNAQAVVVEELYEKPIMSSFHGVFSAGSMVGAGFGAFFTWQETYFFIHLLLISIISFLLLLWAKNYLMMDNRKPNEGKKEPLFRFPTKGLLGLGIIAFCCMLGEGAMHDWTTNYLKNVVMTDAAIAPLGLATFNFFMMIGRFRGDEARLKFGDGKLLIMNSIIAIIGLSIALFFQATVLIMIGLGLVGLGLSVIVPIAYSRSGNYPGIAPGVGIAMLTTIGYAGFIVGPPIIGFIADEIGLRMALFTILFLFLIMCGLSFREYLLERKKEIHPCEKSN